MSIAVAPELMRKLSPDAKQRLSEPGLDSSAPLSVMILGTGPFGPDVLSELAARGVKVRTVAGDVATATVPAGALPALLQVDAVRAVELSRPLQPE